MSFVERDLATRVTIRETFVVCDSCSKEGGWDNQKHVPPVGWIMLSEASDRTSDRWPGPRQSAQVCSWECLATFAIERAGKEPVTA